MVVVDSDGSSGISNPSPRPSILGGSLLWFGLDQNPSSSPQNLLVFPLGSLTHPLFGSSPPSSLFPLLNLAVIQPLSGFCFSIPQRPSLFFLFCRSFSSLSHTLSRLLFSLSGFWFLSHHLLHSRNPSSLLFLFLSPPAVIKKLSLPIFLFPAVSPLSLSLISFLCQTFPAVLYLALSPLFSFPCPCFLFQPSVFP